ncbi:MAG TPA: hypothetical protein VGV35_10595 [Bryobacteraceae bacterium]|nr:hypothetical protein [Bryobacteraceae bacterium]
MRTRAILLLLALAGFAAAQAPSISDGGILNGAGFQKGQPITGGSLISIFGSRLASSVASASSIPLSTGLGGVTVTFVNGNTTLNAPLLYVQPDDPANGVISQINCQVPWNLVPNGGTANVSVTVTRNNVASAPAQVTVGPFSPGIFSSGGRAIAVNADGTLAWPAGVIPGLNTHGAKPGDALIVYATGLGGVDSPIADGAASLDKLRNTQPPIVGIGGAQATVLFSGLAPQFVGVNQLNILVPNVPPNDNTPLQILIGGITTPTNTTISVVSK